MFLVFGCSFYESSGGLEDLISIHDDYKDLIDSLENATYNWWNCFDVVQVLNTNTNSFFVWNKERDIDLVDGIQKNNWKNINLMISKE